MDVKLPGLIIAATLLLAALAQTVRAQQPQIPTLNVCNETVVTGSALVKIDTRVDIQHAGTFKVSIKAVCKPPDYPQIDLELFVTMSDSIANGSIVATSVEQLTTTGKHSPTAYLNGRCKANRITGCQYWMTLADNGKDGTPDIIGFLIFDGTGKRVAYGTGPVIEGDVQVQASPF